MQKINVMVSSVIGGLEAERDAIKGCFSNIPFVELIGAEPFNNTAVSSSSAYATLEMARNCDLYILILSERYGMGIVGDKSATEAEYDVAIKDDPTKIMVFLKDCDERLVEDKQKEFIKKVSDYYSGYFRPKFKYSHQLKDMVLNSFTEWLKERAQLGRKLNYLDHFIRVAKQILPLETTKVFYRVAETFVELEYPIAGTTKVIQYDHMSIARDFWGCINDLQVKCDEWSRG
ncbi:DUF4062 domain-containing protein [Desulfosporosinus sp. FKB]|uniref:DUF4062 domain-containing protein n=1 Tax=Desulfosporosinus sp. FKB TaxID=1969835 RepID=UPI000B4A3776|nr:DUF4062 domain-containing protein [Desulfosporosinus sp. FKB]